MKSSTVAIHVHYLLVICSVMLPGCAEGFSTSGARSASSNSNSYSTPSSLATSFLFVKSGASNNNLRKSAAFVGNRSRTKTMAYIDHDGGVPSSSSSGKSVDVQQQQQQLCNGTYFAGDVEDDILAAYGRRGMPWTESIRDDGSPLLYMPYWKFQMNFMKENLTNLRVIPTGDHSYKESSDGKARIFNMCFQSDEYRKIRMTYYDVGHDCQVFNSLWYPNTSRGDLPVLGIDLLSFNGRKRNLAVVDFQPVCEQMQNDDNSELQFEKRLAFIRRKYKSLQGKMSKRFYDETQFFSKQMLFAKYDQDGIFDVCKDLFPAYQDYVREHLRMVQKSSESIADESYVFERQRAYDNYSAERDPATAMFNKMFGKKWADDFVFNFLFSLSDAPEMTDN